MKNNTPLVSVIVTTFNRKEMLKETILSILNQTYSNFELIVVDNFSDYDFFNFIKSFEDSRLKPFQNKNNGIIAINRNFGLKLCKGDFIAFCDDDDLWYPNNLQSKIDLFIDDHSIGMITSKESIINELGENNGKTTHKWIIKDHFITFKDLFFKNTASTSAAIIRKKCLNEIGYFNESINLNTVEDFDYWLRIAKKFKIFYLNKILGACRVHSKNVSYIDDTQRLNHYLLIKNLLLEKNKKISLFYSDAKYHIVKLKIKLILFYLKQGRLSDSLKWFTKLFID